MKKVQFLNLLILIRKSFYKGIENNNLFLKIFSSVLKVFNKKIQKLEFVEDINNISEKYCCININSKHQSYFQDLKGKNFKNHLIYWRFIKQAIIQSHANSIISDNKFSFFLNPDCGDDKFFQYSLPRFLMKKKDCVYQITDKSIQEINKGIFLGGRWSENWFHWLIDILPRLIWLENLPKNYKDYPLLVPEGLPGATFIEALKILEPRRSIILLKKQKPIKVESLIVIDGFKTTISKIGFYEYPTKNLLIINKDALDKYRKKFLNALSTNNKSNNRIKRIFLARSSQNTRQYNQDEVFKMLQRYGFKKILLQEFSFLDQIQLINDADVIIGPSGAAMANLLFAKVNSNIIIWHDKFADGFCEIFQFLAQVSKSSCHLITYKPGGNDYIANVSNSYKVSITTIENKLKKILK